LIHIKRPGSVRAYPGIRGNKVLEMAMQINVGVVDRSLRLTLGVGLIGAAALGIVGAWGYLGVVPLLTGLFRFCPAYRLIGVNTCSIAKR